MKRLLCILLALPLLAHAQNPAKLTEWVVSRHFDSLQMYLERGGPGLNNAYPELYFALQTLLATENNTWYKMVFPPRFIQNLLDSYARGASPMHGPLAAWADRLLKEKQDSMDILQRFCCEVYAGRIAYPSEYCNRHSDLSILVSPSENSRRLRSFMLWTEEASQKAPRWYAERQFDSLAHFMRIDTDCHCPAVDTGFNYNAVQTSLRILCMIESKTFSPFRLPCDLQWVLSAYTYSMGDIDYETFFTYHLPVAKHVYLDLTRYMYPLFIVARDWAKDLLRRENPMSPLERYLCNVFAGNDAQSVRTWKKTKRNLPVLDTLSDKCAAIERTYPKGLGRVMIEASASAWIPTGPLSRLGVHPSLDFVIGGGNRKNEYAFAFGFRMLRTPTPYYVLRDDTLRARTYYSGTHFGLEYTRFFVHRTQWEIGWNTGISVDNFAVAPLDTSQDKILNPKVISSADWSNGIRVNYFYSRRGHLGLEGAFHLFHYANPGGSNLDGNAFTLRAYIGGN